MKLVFRGHDERYVVEQSLMNLFPGELPVYEPITPGDDSWAVISLEETGDLCRVAVSLCRGGKTTEQTYQEPLSGGDFQREGLRRHAVGACFFLAARAVTGVTPPWGMLTGVRPDKPDLGPGGREVPGRGPGVFGGALFRHPLPGRPGPGDRRHRGQGRPAAGEAGH